MADSLEEDFAFSDVDSNGSFSREEGGREIAVKGEKTLKRRNDAVDLKSDELTEEQRRAKKKRKMKEQDKKRKTKKAANGNSLSPGRLAKLPPDMQADHMRNIMKSCQQFSKLSAMELDEVAIQERMLSDSTSSPPERKLEKIVDFLKKTVPSTVKDIEMMGEAHDERKGQPVLLVITGHAQRAADIAKALRRLVLPKKGRKEDGKPLQVGKLFARHFKKAEQEAFLDETTCPVAVGTPQRIHDLLKDRQDGRKAALNLDLLRTIVLDASWTDVKMRSLLDGIETKEAVCSLLASSSIQSRLKSRDKNSKASILLF